MICYQTLFVLCCSHILLLRVRNVSHWAIAGRSPRRTPRCWTDPCFTAGFPL